MTGKAIAAAVCAALAAGALAGCSSEAVRADSEYVSEVNAALGPMTVAESTASYASDQVDTDLTQMGKTMVYGTVNRLMNNPEAHVGEVMRMRGLLLTQSDGAGNYAQFCVVQDATACCSSGIGFIWDDGSHAYPADFPTEGAEIVVTGKVQTFESAGVTYPYLSNASLELA